MLSTYFRKLAIGNHPFIPSHAEYKRVVLTGQLCIVTMVICVIFAAMDFLQSKYSAIPIEFSCAAVALSSLHLNRHGRHRLAKVLLITTVNLTVFIFSESEPLEIGLYLFFIVSSIGTVAVFGYGQRRLAIIFIVLSLILFSISLFTDIYILPRATVSEYYIITNIFVNFLISLTAATTIVYFLINLNYHAERSLLEKEQLLIDKNEELTKLNAELDRFMYSTSHDLRSPISSVLGLIQLTRMTDDSKEIKGYIGMMEGRLASLNKFIKDISDYSRNARTDVARESVLVHQAIHDIVEGLRFYPGAENVKVEVQIDDHFALETDATRFQIIFSNLIANAFKYVDHRKENPFIRISARPNGVQVQFKVEDNGVGIAENFIPKIFEMFFQAHEKSEGSGLGLFIVRESVHKLDGTIGVKSALGVGSAFEVNLPVNHNS